tara:strand:- start:16 stop:315 length:300 start_codon:yes stop_codon:yes gene_type:complete
MQSRMDLRRINKMNVYTPDTMLNDEILVSTTSLDNPRDFAEYAQGVEAVYELIQKPDFSLKEAYESFHFDPADSYFTQGYYDAVTHELEKSINRFDILS